MNGVESSLSTGLCHPKKDNSVVLSVLLSCGRPQWTNFNWWWYFHFIRQDGRIAIWTISSPAVYSWSNKGRFNHTDVLISTACRAIWYAPRVTGPQTYPSEDPTNMGGRLTRYNYHQPPLQEPLFPKCSCDVRTCISNVIPVRAWTRNAMHLIVLCGCDCLPMITTVTFLIYGAPTPKTLDVSSIGMHLSLLNPLRPGVRSRMKISCSSTDRRCSKASEWSTILLPSKVLILDALR